MGKRKVKKAKFNRKIIPLIMTMFIPLIMYYQYIEYDTVLTNPFYVKAEFYYDLFSFYKTIAIYVIAVLCIVFYLLYTKRNDMSLKKGRLKYYIPIAIYALFILLSTIFSIFPKIAVFGIYERYEGALVLFSYLIFLIYAIEVLRDEIDLNIIFSFFLGMILFLSSIGILQGLGLDIFRYRFFQSIIGLPKGSGIDEHFAGWAYATLYNPNNLGQFASLTAPVAFGIFLAVKNLKMKIVAGLAAFASIAAGFASNSANFYAGVAVAAVIFFILCISHFIPKKKLWKIVLFTIIGCLLVAFVVLSPKIWNRLKRTDLVRKEIESFLPVENDIYFNDIELTDSMVSFDTSKGYFFLRYLEGGITFHDKDMKFIDYNQNGANIVFKEEPYKTQWRVQITSENTLRVFAKRAYGYATIEIIFDEEKFLGIWGTGGSILNDIMDNQMPKKFQGLETIASRRGYLWLVTASRLDEVFFIGAGPDSFLYWFEQNDVVGKVNFLHNTAILADKPHNWFLQMASQTGVVSLLAFLGLLGTYIVSTIKLIGFRRKKTYYEFAATGIVCGLIGYMASSLFVDSTVGVTPIFYVLLGIGIFINEQVKVMRTKDRNLKLKRGTK